MSIYTELYPGIYTNELGRIVPIWTKEKEEKERLKNIILPLELSFINNVIPTIEPTVHEQKTSLSPIQVLLELDKKILDNNPWLRDLHENSWNALTDFGKYDKVLLDKDKYEKHKFEDEDPISFLRNYVNTVELNYLDLSDSKNKTFVDKYKNIATSNKSLASVSKYKRRSMQSLWEASPDWNYENQDITRLLDSPKGKEIIEALYGDSGVYNQLKGLTNGELIINYPDVFLDVMMYALGDYYGKIASAYKNDPKNNSQNEDLGYTSFNKKRLAYNAKFRNELIEEQKKQGVKDEDINIGGWKRLDRNIASIAAALDDIALDWVGEVKSWLKGENEYKNDLRDAAEAVLLLTADYFNLKQNPDLSEEEILRNAKQFDLIAELAWGNYRDDIKELTPEEKSDKLLDLQLKARITKNPEYLLKDLVTFLLNLENKELGKMDYIGTTLWKIPTTIVSILGSTSMFLVNSAEAGGAAIASGVGAAINGEDVADAVIETGIQQLNESLNNSILNYFTNIETTGNFIPGWVDDIAGSNISQRAYKEGIPYTDREIQRLLDDKVIDELQAAELRGSKHSAGKTLGIWTRKAGAENDLWDPGTIQDIVGVASLMGGTVGTSYLARGSGNLLRATGRGLVTRGAALATTRTALLWKPFALNTGMASFVSKSEKLLGHTLNLSGNMINATSNVAANAGLDFGYAKSFYDTKKQEALNYVESNEFRDIISKKAKLLYDTDLDFKDTVNRNAYDNINADIEAIGNLYKNEIELLAQQKFLEKVKAVQALGENVSYIQDTLMEQAYNEALQEVYKQTKLPEYITNALLEKEKEEYLRNADRGATINAGLVHVLASIPDGIISSTLQSSLYGMGLLLAIARMTTSLRQLSNRGIGAMNRGLNRISVFGKKLPKIPKFNGSHTNLLKEFGIQDVNADGTFVESTPYTKFDYYKLKAHIALGGFWSNYQQDLAVGIGEHTYAGYVDNYMKNSLDPDNNKDGINTLTFATLGYYGTLAMLGLLDASDNPRSFIDGILGGVAGGIVHVGALNEAFEESRAEKNGLLKSLWAVPLKAIKKGVLLGDVTEAFTGYLTLKMNLEVKDRRDALASYMEHTGQDLFTSLANMHAYYNQLNTAAGLLDPEKMEIKLSDAALESAYLVGLFKGTAFYDANMKALEKILLLGKYEQNKEKIKNIILIIKEGSQNDSSKEKLELLDAESKEILNYLRNIDFLKTESELELALKWDNGYAAALEMKTMIEDSNLNRDLALDLLPTNSDPTLIHAVTQLFNKRDYLKRKLNSDEEDIELTKAELLAKLYNDKTKSTLLSNGYSIYNLIYGSKAVIQSNYDVQKLKHKKLLEERLSLIKRFTDISNSKELSEEAKAAELFALGQRFQESSRNIARSNARLQALDRAKKGYYTEGKLSNEEVSQLIISAKDIALLDHKSLLDFISWAFTDESNVSDELRREILKLVNEDAEVTDDLVIDANFLTDDLLLGFAKHLLDSHFKLENTKRELSLLEEEINNGIYTSESVSKYYSTIKDKVAKAIYKSSFTSQINDLKTSNPNMSTKDWYHEYKRRMEEIEGESLNDNNKTDQLARAKFELIKILKQLAFREAILELDTDAVSIYEDYVQKYEDAGRTVLGLRELDLNKQEKELVINALKYLIDNYLKPSLIDLGNFLGLAAADADLMKSLTDYINSKQSRPYKSDDLLQVLNSALDTIKSKIAESGLVRGLLEESELSPEEEETYDKIDSNNTTLNPQEKEAKVETVADKQDNEDKTKLNSGVQHFLTSNSIIDADFVLNLLGIKNVKAQSYQDALPKIIEYLRLARENSSLVNFKPLDYLYELLKNIEKSDPTYRYLEKTIEALELVSKKAVSDSKTRTTKGTLDSKIPTRSSDVTKMTDLTLIEDEDIKTLILNSNVLQWLLNNVIPPKLNVLFIRINDKYTGVLVGVSKGTAYSHEFSNSNDVSSKSYFLLIGVVETNSLPLSISDKVNKSEIGKLITGLYAHINNNFKVEKSGNYQVITKDKLEGKDLPKIISVVNNDIIFNDALGSNDTDTNSAAYSVVTSVDILDTVNKKGQSLLEILSSSTSLVDIRDEIKNFNSRTKLLYEQIERILKEVNTNGDSKEALNNLTLLLNRIDYYKLENSGNISLRKFIVPVNQNNNTVGFVIFKDNKSGLICLGLQKMTRSNNTVTFSDYIIEKSIIPLLTSNTETIKITRDPIKVLADLLLLKSNDGSPFFKWQLDNFLFSFNNSKQSSHFKSMLEYINTAAEDGILSIIPAEVSSTELTLFSFNDNDNPIKLRTIIKPVNPTEKLNKEQLDLLINTLNLIFYGTSLDIPSATEELLILERLRIESVSASDNKNTGRNASESIKPEKLNAELAIRLFYGNIADRVLKRVIGGNIIKNSEEANTLYKVYKNYVSKSDFDNLIAIGNNIRAHLVNTYRASHFFYNEITVRHPITGLGFGKPDLVFVTEKGLLGIVDYKTSNLIGSDFTKSLKEDHSNYPILVTLYACTLSDVALSKGLSTGKPITFLVRIPTNLKGINTTKIPVNKVTDPESGKLSYVSYDMSNLFNGTTPPDNLFVSVKELKTVTIFHPVDADLFEEAVRSELEKAGWNLEEILQKSNTNNEVFNEGNTLGDFADIDGEEEIIVEVAAEKLLLIIQENKEAKEKLDAQMKEVRDGKELKPEEPSTKPAKKIDARKNMAAFANARFTLGEPIDDLLKDDTAGCSE